MAKERTEAQHKSAMRLLQPDKWTWLQIIGLIFVVPIGAVFGLAVGILFALLAIGFVAVIGVLFVAFVAVCGAVAIPLGVLGSITAICTAPWRSWSVRQAWKEWSEKKNAEGKDEASREDTNYKDVLEFYAAKDSYVCNQPDADHGGMHSNVEADGGERARKALDGDKSDE